MPKQTKKKTTAAKPRGAKKAAARSASRKPLAAKPKSAAKARNKKAAAKSPAWGRAEDLLQFLDNSPDILISFDREARVLFVTKNIEQYSGIPAKKYIGKRYRDLGYPKERYEFVEKMMSIAFQTGAPNEASVKLDFHGKDYVFNWRIVPERKKGRKTFDTVLCIGRNITEKAIVTEALKISEERYRNFITQSHEAIHCTEFDNPIDTSLPVEEQIDAIYANAYMSECNDTMARIYGAPSVEEFIGMRMVDAHGGPDNPQRRAMIAKFIKSGYRITDEESAESTPEGGTRYLISNNIGVVEDGKLLRVWGTTIDITRIKETEIRLQASLKEKDVLLKEIHHRVKNNLSVIAGLLSLHEDYIRSDSDRAMCLELTGRIQAMAMIHDRLYRSNDLSAVNFKEFVENLAIDLAAAYRVDQSRVRLNAEIEDLSVPIRKAIPCGQILNELISNALKHAFPRGAGGEITVRLANCPGNASMVCLSVEDDGPGFPDEILTMENLHSLGLRLVGLLSEQLGGSMRLENDRGAKVIVEFPSGL